MKPRSSDRILLSGIGAAAFCFFAGLPGILTYGKIKRSLLTKNGLWMAQESNALHITGLAILASSVLLYVAWEVSLFMNSIPLFNRLSRILTVAGLAWGYERLSD
jgi:hypothetical protein